MIDKGHLDKMSNSSNWNTIAESNFPWEREALDFIRKQFPDHEPYRAWSNFEFIATDGSINEVDLLVLTPQGFFLIEIKSRPGRLFGDPGTWTWETDGKQFTADNPLIAANTKAKKLRSLLERQKACKGKGLPFIEAIVFCSAPALRCELQGIARYRVCLRDRCTPARLGIMAAIKRRECPGLDPQPKGTHDRPTAKMIGQALEQAGIRASQRQRRVSDYVLEQLIGEGPGYQDWKSTHTQFSSTKRWVRLYLVAKEAAAEDRKIIERAAEREFQLLEMLQHPGIVRTYGYTPHQLGPALILEYDPLAIRLDHYLAQRKDDISVALRLDLMRQIAEVVRFAHDKKVVHRGLCPQSILVTESERDRPRIKIFNWQVGYRASSTTTGASRVTATSHVERLIDDASTAYLAPEAIADQGVVGEHLDIFSLGAIAFHLFSDSVPAENGLELNNKLRATKGLRISSVKNGIPEILEFLIQFSTHPEVANRIDSVTDFLSLLDGVEKELTALENDVVENPVRAQQGDVLPGNFKVMRRLGQGASSVGLLVERDGQEFVLKVANDLDNNPRLRDEAEVLQKLRHSHIVECCSVLEMGNQAAFLMRPVYADKEKRLVETLGQRLRREGRLHIDLLQRFGEDLLDAVNYLEDQGINHRDIKPDNIAVGQVGRGNRLHLVLFDFSLSKTPTDNIRAGTASYLDPLLPLRKPLRWDLHAERYAAAVTLYELATGTLPQWGDGTTDPSHLDCEIAIDAELFDVSLRDSLTDFFQRAFHRDLSQRFDNAEEMLRLWRDCFAGIEKPGTLSDHENEAELRELLSDATLDMSIPELGLGTRALHALDRANVLTVEDLLTVPSQRLNRLRGVGNQTRREITIALKILRERLGTLPVRNPSLKSTTEIEGDRIDAGKLSVDLLTQKITYTGAKQGAPVQSILKALLGLDPTLSDDWSSQSDIARHLGLDRDLISQWVGKLQSRWSKEPAITKLRADLAEILKGGGGVMSATELAETILVARGSTQYGLIRTQQAMAVLRAAVEVESTITQPRFLAWRDHNRVLVAVSQELASYASQLGDLGDQLADADPLVPPVRALQRLRDVPPPTGTVEGLSDSRLLRLAAAASHHAAVSSRQELYPREMEAIRALKLSQGGLYGMRSLTVEQIRDRVSSRYPEASPLPNRPILDNLLNMAGLDFQWNGDTGSYVSPILNIASITSSTLLSRLPTNSSSLKRREFTPEEADARQFEERLERGIRDGSFLVLLVNPNRYQRAYQELCHRFPVKLIDFEGLFIDALRQVAEQARVNWDLVLKTDATPHQGDWDKLMLLVGRAMPLVEAQLATSDQLIVMIYASLLARYDQMVFLERLRDKVGRADGIPGLWLLIPNEQQAVMDGKAVPILSPGQRSRIPDSWLENRHRAGISPG